MASDDKSPGAPFTPPIPTAQPSLGVRVMYMVIFALVFWILCWTLAITALVQLALTVLAGRPNPDLVRFGTSLAAYSRQIIEFLTFVSERIPFPFSAWPPP
ncbi:MAG: DUF4389 domain-containing protein [Steroidobacteraceae bacterium]